MGNKRAVTNRVPFEDDLDHGPLAIRVQEDEGAVEIHLKQSQETLILSPKDWERLKRATDASVRAFDEMQKES